MKKALVRKIRRVLLVALVLGLPAAVAASQYTHVVVFADSLSDNGNLFALDATQVTAAKYCEGRFSNGPVWVEHLSGADLLDATLVNNAYAGATTGGSSPPGVQLQVSTYVATATAQPDALYIIWVGPMTAWGAVRMSRPRRPISATHWMHWPLSGPTIYWDTSENPTRNSTFHPRIRRG